MMRAFVLAWLAAAAPASAGAPEAAAARLQGKYLDMHCHTAGIGAKGEGNFASPAFKESWKYGVYLKAFGVSDRELRDSGDALVIKRLSAKLARSRRVGAAVVLALDGVVDSLGRLDTARTQIFVANDFVAREARGHPNLLYGASINPKRKDAMEMLFKARHDGAVLVKWIPSIMDFDPGDSAFIPFYRAMQELGLPLLTHTGKESSFLEAKDSLCDPYRLELPLSLGLTVIAAHVGTPGKSHGEKNMERALTLLGKHPNLYADISSLTQVNKLGLLGDILPRKEAKGKLIFGTDFPLIETALVSHWYYFFNLPWKTFRALSKEENPWDRDVELKLALGMPEEVFRLSAELILQGKGSGNRE